MMVAVRQKFIEHPDLREKLLSTGDKMLVEHTSRDKYWGDGSDKGTGTIGRN